jgi:hypothetical protein
MDGFRRAEDYRPGATAAQSTALKRADTREGGPIEMRRAVRMAARTISPARDAKQPSQFPDRLAGTARRAAVAAGAGFRPDQSDDSYVPAPSRENDSGTKEDFAMLEQHGIGRGSLGHRPGLKKNQIRLDVVISSMCIESVAGMATSASGHRRAEWCAR